MTEGKYLLLLNIKGSKKVLGSILGRGHCVLRFHALPVSVCSLSSSKDMHEVKLTHHFKLAVAVNVIVNGCLSQCVSPATH